MSRHDLACVSWSDNPLAPMAEHRAVEPGAAIISLLPAGWEQRRVICRYNGRWILRVGWACPVQAGDVIEFHELVEGRNGLRTVLSIVVIAAAIVASGGAGAFGLTGAQLGAVISVVGSLAVNALVPLQGPEAAAQGQSFASVYNVSVSGNQARVDQAIPVIYGRHLVKPDYAAEPYYTFDANGDQYGHFLYCVGQGRYEIEQTLIGRTLLSGFQDITTSRMLQPGEPPLTVAPTVVTSREVISLDLPAGRRVGGYAVCAPTKTVYGFGLDFVCPRGQAIPIAVQISTRQVDNDGVGLTPWTVRATETVTGDTSKPTRVSFYYPVSQLRLEVRVARVTPHNDDPGTPNEIEWAGMRGYIAADAPLCPTATHYELVIRASEQLSSLSQNQFGLVVRRLLRTWSPGVGWTASGAEVATRNWVHAYVDLLTNPDYTTDPLNDSQVDLAGLHALSLTAAARQDRCDLVFDSFVNGWDAASTIARTGRATPFRRNGVATAARDETQTFTVCAFDSRSILPGSFNVSLAHPDRQTPDGVIAEYFDFRSWDWVEIECPAPGYTVTDPSDPRYNPALSSMRQPERKRYRGITGPKHAEREGLYDAAWPVYRRRIYSWSTEQQGLLPCFGAEVLLAPVFYLQSGDVAFWDEGTLVMGLTEPVVFAPGEPHVLSLTRDNGSLHPPIAVTPGPTEYDVVLAAAPDFPLVLDDGTRERPRWQFGAASQYERYVRITGIAHQGMGEDSTQIYSLRAVADDDRVHLVDVALLPAAGELQDLPTPGTAVGGGDGGGGETNVYVVRVDNSVLEVQTNSSGSPVCTYRMRNNGTVETNALRYILGAGWMLFGEIEPAVAARYEVLATKISETLFPFDGSFGGQVIGTFDTWISLASNPEWSVSHTGGAGDALLQFRIDVRDELDVVQDTATIDLRAQALPF